MEVVKSRENAAVKELAGLLSRKKSRDASGCFALEGLRLCLDALDSGVKLETLYVSEQALAHSPQVERLRAAAKTVLLSDELAHRIADTRSTQGVFCTARKLDNKKSAVKMERNGKYLLLDSLQDPGNLGAALRTAAALGMDGAFLCGCPDLYAPKVLRAAMGGIFRLPVAVVADMCAAVRELRSIGVRVLAAALTDAARPVGETDLSGGCALLIGNEGAGLPPALIAACDAALVIPMRRGSESLNASAAAAILIWEAVRHP